MKKGLKLRTQENLAPLMFINSLKSIRQRIHVADVAVTSERADEVLKGVSQLLNDVCFDLDEITDRWEPLLKSGKKSART